MAALALLQTVGLAVSVVHSAKAARDHVQPSTATWSSVLFADKQEQPHAQSIGAVKGYQPYILRRLAPPSWTASQCIFSTTIMTISDLHSKACRGWSCSHV